MKKYLISLSAFIFVFCFSLLVSAPAGESTPGSSETPMIKIQKVDGTLSISVDGSQFEDFYNLFMTQCNGETGSNCISFEGGAGEPPPECKTQPHAGIYCGCAWTKTVQCPGELGTTEEGFDDAQWMPADMTPNQQCPEGCEIWRDPETECIFTDCFDQLWKPAANTVE